jgi:ankyrin repeat protein
MGNIDGVRNLLEKELTADTERRAVVVNTISSNRWPVTPLFHAAVAGAADMLAMLLRHGADVNFSNERGEMALHCAIEHGNQRATQMLLDAGAYCDNQLCSLIAKRTRRIIQVRQRV